MTRPEDTVREALNDAIQNRTYGAIIEHEPLCASLNGRECNCTYARAEAASAALDELLAERDRLRDALERAKAMQPARVQWFRDNGIVFNRAPLSQPWEEDGERWEQIAFSVYTDLCEIEAIARAALGKQ